VTGGCVELEKLYGRRPGQPCHTLTTIPLCSNPDPMWFNKEEFPLVLCHVWVGRQVFFSYRHYLANKLGMIPHLKADYAFITTGWICD